MEAINEGCWKTACLSATPTKVLLAYHLCLLYTWNKDIKMDLIFERISQLCLVIFMVKNNK